MIIELKLKLDYDPETGECKVLSSEKVSKPEKVVANNDTAEPQVILDANKYILNQAAADLLGVKWEDRLDIKYQKISGITYPIIGTSEAFGTKSGNKLTKSLSVSYRGKANDMLAKYGSTFTLTEFKGHENLFVLIGDNPPIEEMSDEIEVIEDADEHIDLPLDANLENEDVEQIDPLSFTL